MLRRQGTLTCANQLNLIYKTQYDFKPFFLTNLLIEKYAILYHLSYGNFNKTLIKINEWQTVLEIH